MVETMMGSSPHTRGPRLYTGKVPHGPGFIPAYAGSTFFNQLFQLFHWVHPRIRGVHPVGAVLAILWWGSSPHTRGPRRFFLQSILNNGFIPAYAGSTAFDPLMINTALVHPRIRGVHTYLYALGKVWAGSSPHTRGPLFLVMPSPFAFGFIPAYAGSTSGVYSAGKPPQVHPRIRGVHGRMV